MERFVPFLFFASLSLSACVDEPGDSVGAAVEGVFCGPALARVDSFMATFAGREPAGERYGGMAVVGTVADMQGMSPAAGDVGSAQHQQFVNLMTLLQFDENLEPVPYLANSWEVSDDQSEITFRLREDVYWHDGELTTAHDVAFTYLTAINPASQFPNPSLFQEYLPGEEGVEVVDSFTVKFRFRPHADVLESWRTLAVLPQHLLGDTPAEELVSHPYGAVCPVGNGLDLRIQSGLSRCFGGTALPGPVCLPNHPNAHHPSGGVDDRGCRCLRANAPEPCCHGTGGAGFEGLELPVPLDLLRGLEWSGPEALRRPSPPGSYSRNEPEADHRGGAGR